jgi:uncharacterized protein (TIGR03437 family)
MKTRWRVLAVLAWTGMVGRPAPAADSPQTVYRIETVAGSAWMGDGGPASAAQIGAIQGVAVDRLGNVYLSDTDNSRVRRVDTKGIITTVAGTGVAGFGGDGGPATAAQLNLPYGLAADAAGYLYIADLGNNRVRRIAPDGTISTVAGNGYKASAGEGEVAAEAPLLMPRNVAVDSIGNFYISEFEGHRVRCVTSNGKMTTLAGTGVAGYGGDNGPGTAAQLNSPAGLAVDSAGAVYVADSANNRIRKIVSNGYTSVITTFLGATAAGGTSLTTPTAVAVNSSGTLFVVDGATLVHSFTPSNGAWIDYAGSYSPGFSGDGGPATAASLTLPRDVAASAGAVYIADGTRVRYVDVSHAIHTLAGDGYLHAIGDGGLATAAALSLPNAVALDASGNLFIADTGTERVRQVSAAGIMGTLAGTGVAGYGMEPGPATTAPLNAPSGLAMDPAGGVIIADSGNNRIREVGRDGLIHTIVGVNSAGLAPDGYVPPILAPLNNPRGVCVDPAGVIYIVDTGNHRVWRAVSGTDLTDVAGNGTAGDVGDGGPARLAMLDSPSACALDSAGNLYIADTGSHRIRKTRPDGVIVTIAGIGAAGFGGDGGLATAAALNSPRGVAADSDGNVYIADTGNNRIRQITPDGIIRTIAGQDGAAFAGDGGPAVSAWLNAPAGLVLDGSGDLYLADSGNNRVRRLVPDGVIAPAGISQPAAAMVVNAASMAAGPVAPGEIVSIFGTGFGPAVGATGAYGAGGLLSTALGGAEVRFAGVSAPLFYAQAGQINAQVPYETAGDAAHVEIYYQGQLTGATDVQVAAAAPAIFPVIVNPNGWINSASARAGCGDIVVFYATGEGLNSAGNVTGQAAAAPYPQPWLPVGVTVAGIGAEILYAGSAPGLVGTMQLNVRVPCGFVPPGQTSIQLTVGSFASPAVTVWLQ